MKVLFDGFWWAGGPMANRTVQREFIDAWREAFPEDEIAVALRRGADDSGLRSTEVVRTRLWPHALSNRWELPRIARRCRADVTIAHNYAPRRGRSLVFIHDVMYEEHPEWFSLKERAYFAPMLPWARTASVIAASTHTEAGRIRRLGKNLPQPAVTGLAAPTSLVRAGERRPPVVRDGGFALTVGRLNVRKNLESVLRGAARSTRITPTSPLYVVGSSAHSGVGMTLPEEARRLLDSGAVVFLGGVEDAELAWLYRRAELTISLSLDEGFGMPAVEAAVFGSPLLVSDIPVYRETVGDIAAFIDPGTSPEPLGAAIDAAWGHRPAQTAVDGIRERFSWQAAVRTMREALSADPVGAA
ncbi:glycosyltransferase family 4 protein [Microbacterium sp.]|uniref:glycosyltransferase family 4 protein n=1 Tax=Microbacterium sp. TaxID=51671 RepID=UPI003C794197